MKFALPTYKAESTINPSPTKGLVNKITNKHLALAHMNPDNH